MVCVAEDEKGRSESQVRVPKKEYADKASQTDVTGEGIVLSSLGV